MTTTAGAGATTGWLRWLPGIVTLRRYERSWLRTDLVAGVVLAALLVPQGMGYAEAAGMPAVTGLYTTIACLVAYAVFGPSRRLVLGPDSSLAPLIAAAIVPLATTSGERIAVGSFLSLTVGVLCIVAGLAKAGTITELISAPARLGYLAGLAVIVIAEQVPKMLGFTIDAERFRDQIREIVSGIEDGLVDPTTVVVGVTCLASVLLLNRVSRTFPGVLLVVVGATAVSAALDLAAEGVAVVGLIPSGFPAPAIPHIDGGDIAELLAAAVGIALVAMADTSALSKSVAHQNQQDVDQNQEVMAIGASNIATGLFQGFAISASSSRTAVAQSLGARTQLSGVTAAAVVLVLLVTFSAAVEDLPQATLAAIVISAVLGFVDIAGFRYLWRVRRAEFALASASALAVIALGPLEGIAVAVLLSLGDVLRRVWHPHNAVLGRIDGRKGYHDLARHPEAHQIPGLLLFRYDAPLFFANADHFTRRIQQLMAEAPHPVHAVIVAAEPITDVDTTAATELDELITDLEARGIALYLAELKGPVKDRLATYGILDRIGEDRLFPTLGTAIDAYVEESGVEWIDWQERDGP